MCAEDNDCYYEKWRDALNVNELRDFGKACLTFGLPGAESTSSDEESNWNLPHSPSLSQTLRGVCLN